MSALTYPDHHCLPLTTFKNTRKFFPPTEQDLSHSEHQDTSKQTTLPPEEGESTTTQSAPASLAAKLPDPPTNEPTVTTELAEGQPEAKKLKVTDTSKADEKIDEGWEELERSAESAENGPAIPTGRVEGEPAVIEATIGDKKQPDEEMAAGGIIEGPRATAVENRLGKDW